MWRPEIPDPAAPYDAIPPSRGYSACDGFRWWTTQHSPARYSALPASAQSSCPSHLPCTASCPVACCLLPVATGYVSFARSEAHTSELQSLMRNSYAVFCLKNNTTLITQIQQTQ